MISVIVPIYNVEKYLCECLDSIVNQTYKNLEILLVDDGSTDNSGLICDEYKNKDGRIRVFHTENGGLSAARNYGIDNAIGDYIGFVDSDDWIEADMYECLLNAINESNSDISCCGITSEYKDYSFQERSESAVLNSTEAIQAMLRDFYINSPCTKLFRRCLFEQIRFPEGRVFEEYSTTYKLISVADRIRFLDSHKYHYRRREGSISQHMEIKSYVDYWIAHKERYSFIYDMVDEPARSLLRKEIALSIEMLWVHYYDFPSSDRNCYRWAINETNDYTRKLFPLFGDDGWGIRIRIGIFFPHYCSDSSLRIARLLNKIGRKIVEV